jgi:hypothetical protein
MRRRLITTSNRDPWPDKYIEQRVPSRANIDNLRRVLEDAKDERPLQAFLAATPVLLKPLAQAVTDVWCFDRPGLGRELFPDFLLAVRLSTGIQWTYVELESPNVKPLNKAGRPSGKLAIALGQVRDWRIWLRENIAYARMHLGLTSIDAECNSVIVIGRRAMIAIEHVLKYQELSRENVAVMTYDRLVELATTIGE